MKEKHSGREWGARKLPNRANEKHLWGLDSHDIRDIIVSCFKCPEWGAAVSDNIPLLFAALQPSLLFLNHTTSICLLDISIVTKQSFNLTFRSQCNKGIL
jgi:hypothetical protein